MSSTSGGNDLAIRTSEGSVGAYKDERSGEESTAQEAKIKVMRFITYYIHNGAHQIVEWRVR